MAKEKKKSKTFRICADTLARMEAQATEQNRTINNMVETALKEWLKAKLPTAQ